MNENLQTICSTVSNNFQAVSSVFTIGYKSSFAAYGVINMDREPSIDQIKECKQFVEERLGKSSVFGTYAPKVLVIAKALRSSDPEGMINRMNEIYEVITKPFGKNTLMPSLAVLLADYPGDINALTAKAEQILTILRKRHPVLGVSTSFYPVIFLMAASEKSVEDMMSEADVLNEMLRKSYKFDKENAYALSFLLSASSEPSEWKAKAADALRTELKAEKIKYSWYGSVTILAALSAASMRTDRGVLVSEIAEADKFLASQKGIGGAFGLSEVVRRAAAAACVLKALGEADGPFPMIEYLTVMTCAAQIKSEQDSSAATSAII